MKTIHCLIFVALLTLIRNHAFAAERLAVNAAEGL